MTNNMLLLISLAIYLFLSLGSVCAFTISPISGISSTNQNINGRLVKQLNYIESFSTFDPCSKRHISLSSSNNSDDAATQIVGKKIIVKGDVNNGYVRTCIVNEASRFRKLIGTMSPPSEGSDTAEIYVEGKAKTVEGFIRWCKNGTKNLGLSQRLEVVKVTDEDPSGLYDGFYAKTGR